MGAVVRCPNCSNDFKTSGFYDVDINKTVVCPACGYVSSKWSFDFVEGDATPEDIAGVIPDEEA